MVKICLAGYGKMNREVYTALQSESWAEVVSILDPQPQEIDGVKAYSNPRQAFEPAEVVIDFSLANACAQNAVIAAQMGKNLVIGTTGLNPQQLSAIKQAIAASGASGVISANFSVGVNVFIEAAKFLHERLQNYNLEMVDVHHTQKKDLPSGTALRTLAALGKTPQQVPVHSLRIGDVIGDHTLVFGGNSERIELTHRATSRRCFGQGAVLSAKWVAGKHDGSLHDFKELIQK